MQQDEAAIGLLGEGAGRVANLHSRGGEIEGYKNCFHGIYHSPLSGRRVRNIHACRDVKPAKFRFDKAPPAPCVAGMSSPEKKPFSIVSLVIDLVLTGIAFVIFFTLVKSHVPSNDPKMIILWGSLASLCLSGVFWLALQMLKVVFNFQRELRK